MMKKILSIAAIIMTMLLIGTVPALADDATDGQTAADYSSLTDVELVALIVQNQDKGKQLSEEIQKLNNEDLPAANARQEAAEEEYEQAKEEAEAKFAAAKAKAKSDDDQMADTLEATEQYISQCEAILLEYPDEEGVAQNLEVARQTLAAVRETKAGTEDRLRRANALSLDEAMSQEISDPDFKYLNEYVQKIKDAEAEKQAASDEIAAIQQSIRDKQNEQEELGEQSSQMIAVLQNRRADNREENNKTDPVPVPAPVVGAVSEDTSSAQTREQSASEHHAGVPTGDVSDIALPVAGFITASVLLVAALMLKKKHKA